LRRSSTSPGVRRRRTGGPRFLAEPRLLAAAACIALPLAPQSAGAWGERTHEIINRSAVERLPEPARSAWAPLAVSLGRHASDADHRKGSRPGERPRHYIDIDFYDEPPFSDVPRDLAELVRRHGKDVVERWGVVPWAVEECYRMLVLSLARGDWSSAGAWAADLGHYVADSHQPLHCTMNYDGQKSGNDGIHVRFEVHMMDRHFREEEIPRLESLPDLDENPVEACFTWIAEAHRGVAPLLAADDVARAADPHYGDRYHAALWNETSAVAARQVASAVHDLAALYLAAWEEAGSPPGPPQAPLFLALPSEALERPPSRPGRDRGAWIVAGTVLLGAFLLGSGS
jgi:hypothetical protein